MSETVESERIAKAVLFEGFLLYPYRLSSVKNRHRWNFGVLYPEPFCGSQGERSASRTECLVAAGSDATVAIKVRFLHLHQESAVEREIVTTDLGLEDLLNSPRQERFSFIGVKGLLQVEAQRLGDGLHKLTTTISNTGSFLGENRDEALTLSMISTHAILSVQNGKFISLIDPAQEFASAVAQCQNAGLWPVLTSRDDTQMLSAPIILYDYPQIAPQSPGDLFDGTEIDEILTLRIRSLSDNEKQEMRVADERVRAILERSEALTPDELSRLHAEMFRSAGREIKKGDRVRLKPRRRADIFDIVLEGKLATVVSVEQDFEDGAHVCVTVDDDPGKDLGLEGKPGHRFFFRADELESA